MNDEQHPTFHRSGEPTEETLKTIQEWPLPDWARLIEYCREAWNTTYGVVRDEPDGGVAFITGGWSDNESISSAMMRNRLFVAVCWQASYRGGKDIFKAPITADTTAAPKEEA